MVKMDEKNIRYYNLYDSFKDSYGIIRTTIPIEDIKKAFDKLRKDNPNYSTDDIFDALEEFEYWECIETEEVYF